MISIALKSLNSSRRGLITGESSFPMQKQRDSPQNLQVVIIRIGKRKDG